VATPKIPGTPIFKDESCNLPPPYPPKKSLAPVTPCKGVLQQHLPPFPPPTAISPPYI
jgi:hypothetical protein